MKTREKNYRKINVDCGTAECVCDTINKLDCQVKTDVTTISNFDMMVEFVNKNQALTICSITGFVVSIVISAAIGYCIGKMWANRANRRPVINFTDTPMMKYFSRQCFSNFVNY